MRTAWLALLSLFGLACGAPSVSRVAHGTQSAPRTRSYNAFIVNDAYGGAIANAAMTIFASRMQQSSQHHAQPHVPLRKRTAGAVNALRERTTASLEALGRGWTPPETPPLLVSLQRNDASRDRMFA